MPLMTALSHPLSDIGEKENFNSSNQSPSRKPTAVPNIIAGNNIITPENWNGGLGIEGLHH